MDKQELAFSEAMLTKLRLNREQRSRASGTPTPSSVPSEPTGGLRTSIAQKVTKRHPGLTQQQVEQMMERDGF